MTSSESHNNMARAQYFQGSSGLRAGVLTQRQILRKLERFRNAGDLA